MPLYCNYVDNLIKTLEAVSGGTCISRDQIASLIDGSADEALIRGIPLATRKSKGMFFTSKRISSIMIELANETASPVSVYDPACGAGDLLLAVAKKLPIARTVSETIRSWSQHLRGMDIESSFVSAAKLRLCLLAVYRGAICDIKSRDIDKLFSFIEVGDFMSCIDLSNVDLVLMNPPYSLVKLDTLSLWSSGKTSQAAIFMEKVVSVVREGVVIVALLPEVLRSGSRYHAWRNEITKHCQVRTLKVIGRFDNKTDIDVFLISLRKDVDAEPTAEWFNNDSNTLEFTLSDFFDIHIGPVVPHRDRQEGPVYKYITVSEARPWGVINFSETKRRYFGTVYHPPFVVIRRTSRVESPNRAIATIINCNAPVAVENHLIILVPKNGSFNRCVAAIKYLQSHEVDEWLNKRIRCRHLTVRAIRAIPIPRAIAMSMEE